MYVEGAIDISSANFYTAECKMFYLTSPIAHNYDFIPLSSFFHWNRFSGQRFINSKESVKFLSRSFDMARRTEFLSRSLIFRRGD